MRAQPQAIPAPPFPRELPWMNTAALRMDKQLGRPVLVEFWDFCRVNSLRTMPYLQAWHDRYAERGLRIIGVHTGGYEFSRDESAIRAAVERLGIRYPVVIDSQLEIWDFYGNQGWPARYLWDTRGALFSLHYGEGAYEETEREIQELLDIDEPLTPPVRPEDAAGVLLPAQTEDCDGPYSGPYEAGEVWAVCHGKGELRVNGSTVEVRGPGCYPLIRHPAHTAAELDLEAGDGVSCVQTCFIPGLSATADAPGPPATA